MCKLYQNDPEQYESLLKEKLVLLIGEANFNKLEKLVEKLQGEGNILFSSEEYLQMTTDARDELQMRLMNNIPSMSQLMKTKKLLTRSVSESQCLQDCADTRDEAIEEAAVAALCGMFLGLAACLASGGFASVAGLAAAFAAAHQGDIALQNAQNAYERCLRYC